MNVLRCVKLPRSEGTNTVNGNGKRYTDHYKMIVDDPAANMDQIVAALRKPDGTPIQFGDLYNATASPLAMLIEINPRQDQKSLTAWDIEVVYSSVSQSIDGTQQPENPLHRSPEINYDYIQTTKAVERDINDKPLCYSSGEVIQGGLEDDDMQPVLTITLNLNNFSSAVSRKYTNKVNSEPFLGAPTRCVKCAGITASLQSESGYTFWRVTYVFHYREETKPGEQDGWRRYVLDEGVYERVPIAPGSSLKVLKQIKDKAGFHVTSPVPLDGAGQQLDLSDPEAKAGYVKFDLKKEADFNELNLF